ncbi:MAG: translocation/assembly module TamB domain-containing protein [Bacillota bacterium]
MKKKFRWKIILVILIIIVGLTYTGYIYKNDFIKNIEDDIVAKIEKNYEIEINFSEIKIWPFNQLILDNLTIEKEDKTIFSASELKVYYNIIEIIKDGRNFELNNPGNALNYIEINEADINIIDFSNFQSEVNESEKNQVEKTENEENNSFIIPQDLRDDLSGVEISIFNSNLKSEINNYDFSLENLDAEFEFKENEIILKNKSDLKINNLNIIESEIKDIEFANLELQLVLANSNDWELKLNSNYFSLAPFNKILEDTDILASLNKNITIKDIKGDLKGNLEISGKEFSIQNYETNIDLKNSSFLIEESDFLKESEVKNINGEILVSSTENKIRLNKFNFSVYESDYRFTGNYGFENDSITGDLNSYNFALQDLENVFSQVKNYSPRGSGRLSINISGDLQKPQATLDFYLNEGEIDNHKINNFRTEARYRDGLLYLDSFDVLVNDKNNVMVEGIYNHYLKEYNFSFKGRKLETELINNYFNNEQLAKINGNLNLNFNISAKGFKREDLNILGDVELNSPEFGTIYSDIWFGRERLILDEGFWNLNGDYLNFEGEVNLVKEEFDIDLDGTELSLENLENKLGKIQESELPDIKGKMTFEAELNGDFSSPEITGDFQINNSKYSEFDLGNIEGQLKYEKNELIIDQFVLNDNGKIINGVASIDFTKSIPYFEADLATDNLDYEYLKEKAVYFGIENLENMNLPMEGDIEADLKLSGDFAKPEIRGNITSENTVFKFAENEISTDKILLSFNLNNEQILELENLELEKGESKLNLSGLISREDYDLKYNGQNLNLTELGLSNLVDIELEALANFSGTIKGDLNSPEIAGNLNLKNVIYDQNKLENIEANYVYSDGNLKLSKTFWKFAKSEFEISGEITDIINKPELDLLVSTERGNIDKILDIFSIDPGFNIGYFLEGEAEIDGDLKSPTANLDLSAYSMDSSDSKININGILNNELNLKLIGTNVKLNKFINVVDSDLELKGSADFYGLISGSVDNYNLDLTTNVDQAVFEGFTANNIKGYLNYSKGSNLNIHQNLNLGEEGNISLDGKINPSTTEMDLNVISENLPLNLLEGTIEMASKIDGTANGQFAINGNFSNPELSGELNFSGGEMDLNLPYKFSDYSGKLELSNDYLEIVEFEAKYDQADFSINGRVYPFEREKFWDLSLKGKNIPLDHGSFAGQFDTQGVQVTGGLFEPRLEGELLTHDFVASTPFEWPTSEGESSFQPQLELTLKPGKEVYFRSGKNIDVLVQEGELTLILEDEFQMEGQLTSRQGTFDYYSNKFLLDSATANFRRFEGVIPTVHVAATTLVDGVRINIRLDGPADNMIVSLTSQPDLEQNEIVALLTQKGGLGEFITKEDLQEEDISKMVRREFIRILQGTFQLSFISELETNLEDMLRLDRIEIDTYELGWNDEITITAGKSITDKLYLEYINTVGVDNIENELSFSYPLTDKTRLEGSWYGNSEFSLSIDTVIEF